MTLALLVPTLSQKCESDRVECASDDGVAKPKCSKAATQLGGGLASKGEDGDMSSISRFGQASIRHATSQYSGLSRSCAGDDSEQRSSRCDRRLLRRV